MAIIAALMYWPQSSLDATVGLNPSWQAGWALARIHHIAWGPGIVYTFGPLGFLQNTAYYSFSQSVFASVYQPIVVAALFLGIAAALRQRISPIASLIGAFATTGVLSILHTGHGLSIPGLEYPELTILAAVAWAAVPLLQQDPRRSTALVTSCLLGAVAGFQLMIKLNSGMAILVIALTMSVLIDWKAIGRHVAALAAFAASVLVFWVLSGQRLSNLAVWLRYSKEIVSGYSDGNAMPLPAFAPLAVPAVFMGLAWISVLCALFFRGAPDVNRSFVVYMGLMTLVLAKKNFVRLDVTSLYAFMGLIVVGAVITPLGTIPKFPRRTFVVILVSIVVAQLGVESAVLRSIGAQAEDPVVAAVQAPGQAVDRLLTLAQQSRVERRIRDSKVRQRALYNVPAEFVETIGSASVHIDPNETSAVWAYDFAWDPAPVFQSYSAYTPALDALNADSLSEGPQFVLSRRSPSSPATGIDGRLEVQQSPRYSRALLCDYTVEGVKDRWVLFRRDRPRCGPLTALSHVDVHGGERVTVPSPSGPDTAVLVAVDLRPSLIDRLFQGFIAPLTITTVLLDGVAYRILAANAAEPWLVATPAAVANTNLQIRAHTVGIGRAPSLGQGDIVARLRFYEMRVQS